MPWQDEWYQTFLARGSSVTGVSFRLAGTSATQVEVSILTEDSGKPVTQWQKVSGGASRRVNAGAIGDTWVKWISGTVPTVPGKKYAVRLKGISGGDKKFSPFNRAKDSYSYKNGQAYDADGIPQAYDLNVTIFSDSDGTVVSYCKTTSGIGELRDGFFAGRWGQTFKAIGNSLAAVDVWAAGGDKHWDLDFTFTVKKNGPGGERIGSVKTTKAAYQAFGAGLHAVSYNPGEITLTPGKTYYVEFTNPGGFNPYVMDNSQDVYSGGSAFKDGAIAEGGSIDLAMTILEYSQEGGGVEGHVKSDAGSPLPGINIWLDPAGGDSAGSGSITWSPWHRQLKEATAGWKMISVEAEAHGPYMTLYLDFLQNNSPGGEWHINCFDSAGVEDLTPPGKQFRRGDSNNDGKFDLSDAIHLLSYLFSGTQVDCLDALDTQDDGGVDLADAIYLLSYLFTNGPAPLPPGISCGIDPTDDAIDCEVSRC